MMNFAYVNSFGKNPANDLSRIRLSGSYSRQFAGLVRYN